MTIYYYEGLPIVAPLTFGSNEPYYDSDSVSLGKQRVGQNAQRWELSFNVQTVGAETSFLLAHITGRLSVRTMVMPQPVSPAALSVNPTPSVASGIQVDGNLAANSAAFDFNKVSGAAGVVVRRGTFIQFSNHTKLYMLTTDIPAGATGAAVGIFPTLRKAVPTGTTVRTLFSSTPPTLSYYISLDTPPGITYQEGVMVGASNITLEEAI